MVVDKKMSEEIPPYHIPQLQMEMLCADAKRGWYVYVNATRGVRIIEVERDDAYLAEMLTLLHRFKIEGGPACFDAAHDRFSERTMELSKRAKEYRHVLPSEMAVMQGGKGRWFQ